MSSRFGERLRKLRLERGVSISFLARSTGLSRSSIYTWESGKKSPKSMETIQILADFFGIMPEQFFRDADSDANLRNEVRLLREEVADLRQHIKGEVLSQL